MREAIAKATKEAMKSKNEIALSTLRLMNAAIKDKDIEARAENKADIGITDEEIIGVLSTMIKRRRESAQAYRDGNREDLASREEAEIKIIEPFMPKQLDDAQVEAAIEQALTDTEANSIKDMGKVMNKLKTEYAGQMDFASVSGRVKSKLMAG